MPKTNLWLRREGARGDSDSDPVWCSIWALVAGHTPCLGLGLAGTARSHRRDEHRTGAGWRRQPRGAQLRSRRAAPSGHPSRRPEAAARDGLTKEHLTLPACEQFHRKRRPRGCGRSHRQASCWDTGGDGSPAKRAAHRDPRQLHAHHAGPARRIRSRGPRVRSQRHRTGTAGGHYLIFAHPGGVITASPPTVAAARHHASPPAGDHVANHQDDRASQSSFPGRCAATQVRTHTGQHHARTASTHRQPGHDQLTARSRATGA